MAYKLRFVTTFNCWEVQGINERGEVATIRRFPTKDRAVEHIEQVGGRA